MRKGTDQSENHIIEFEGVSNNLKHLYDKTPRPVGEYSTAPEAPPRASNRSGVQRQQSKVIHTKNSKGGGMSARGGVRIHSEAT